MPALPPAPDVVRVDFEFDLGGTIRAGIRQYWSFSGGPPTVANLNTLATSISGAFASDLAGLMSTDFSLIKVVVTDLTSDTAAEGSWTGSVAGANSGSSPTIDTSVLQSFTIARRYRGGKPRTYWPFGITTNLNSDRVTWSTTFLSTCASAWDSYKAALLALTGIGITLTDHVNVSYYKGFASVQNPVTKRWSNIPTPRTGDATIDGVTGYAFKAEISQQRRRRTSTSA